MKTFDPNAAAFQDSGIFGLPFTPQEATLVLLPIPWEVTTSYGGGTSHGPSAILEASKQVDLYDIEIGNFYEKGIAMLDESPDVKQWNSVARKLAHTIIEIGGNIGDSAELHEVVKKVNVFSEKLNKYVYNETKNLFSENKLVGVIGGDHSSPFGAIQAFVERYPDMGVLHFDAHLDMRKSYENFEYSHASIMYNVITKTNLKKLVQVGIRDFCEDEFNFTKQYKDRVQTFYDTYVFAQKACGKNWFEICEEIVNHLPQEVYISFDIDCLDQRFCPHTGTPVPGGLDYQEALFLIKTIVKSGKKIIGFDLNEVSLGNVNNESFLVDVSTEWDANVAARLLYKLCGWTLTGMDDV